MGQGEEPQVRQHHATRAVGLCGSALAPRRHLLRHGARAARHAADVAQLPPCLFGDARWRAVAEHLLAFAQCPFQAPECPQLFGEHVAQLQQVGDVVQGVGDLALRNRTDQPVGEPVGLGERNAEHLVHQAGQRRRGEPEEAGDDLGVEDGGGDGPAGRHEHIEILRRGVGHRDARPAEDPGQRRRVHRERVDERHDARPGDLNECQVGDVGLLGVELGVEAVAVLRGHFVHQRLEALGVDHHGRRRAHRGVASTGLGPGALVFVAGREG